MIKKGFTLVELSIVLVIIGLLVGGILIGKSLISTARVNSIASQIQQFDSLLGAFVSKHRGLPGDSKFFYGDGNGVINNLPTHGNNVTMVCEVAHFWGDLDEAYTKSYCPTSVKVVYEGDSKNAPAAKYSKKAFFLGMSINSGTGCCSDLADPRNYYMMLDSTQLQSPSIYGNHDLSTTTDSNSAMLPADLLALDKKMDDGLGTTGNVISGKISNVFGPVGGPITTALTTCSNNTTGAYVVSTSTYSCTPMFRMGGQIENPM